MKLAKILILLVSAIAVPAHAVDWNLRVYEDEFGDLPDTHSIRSTWIPSDSDGAPAASFELRCEYVADKSRWDLNAYFWFSEKSLPDYYSDRGKTFARNGRVKFGDDKSMAVWNPGRNGETVDAVKLIPLSGESLSDGLFLFGRGLIAKFAENNQVKIQIPLYNAAPTYHFDYERDPLQKTVDKMIANSPCKADDEQ